MSVFARAAKSSVLMQIGSHLRLPLFRNGYALVLSSAVTAGLGMLYWIVAARTYPPEVIGLNSAALSVLTFLAFFSELNLMSVLNRFIPSAGKDTPRLIGYSYAISAFLALVVSLVFLAGLDLWAPSLGFLRSSPVIVIWFTASAILWCIFVLQDSALTGLRQATWVPVGNTVFAILKIGFLVVLAQSIPSYGVLASWTVPLLLTIVPVNLLLFRKLIPRHVIASEGKAQPIVLSHIARYVASDYFGSVLTQATYTVLPIMVTQQIGATENAYYYLAWTMAYSLYLVSISMGQSLLAEGATDPGKLDAYSYRVFVQTLALLVPVVAVVLVGAPDILLLFGKGYSSDAATLLRLLALSALPHAVTSIYTTTARVRRRMRTVVVVPASLSILTISLSYFLMGTHGITGIGMAWLISQTAMAVILLAGTRLRTVWLSKLHVPSLTYLLSFCHRPLWYWDDKLHVLKAPKLTADVLTALPIWPDLPPIQTWDIHYRVGTFADLVVVALGPPRDAPVVLLKMPRTTIAAANLRRQNGVLTELRADSRLGDWRALLPLILAEGQAGKQPYTVERIVPGVVLSEMLFDPESRARLLHLAVEAIGGLHRRTARSVQADAQLLQQWVDAPIATLRRMSETGLHHKDNAPALMRLAEELRATLMGRTLAVSWTHGDFAPGNILMAPDGSKVTGIIDWDLAVSTGLPATDVMLFLLAIRTPADCRAMGEIMQELLTAASWTSEERTLLETHQLSAPGDALEMRTVLLLTWLWHVTANFSKSTFYVHHPMWLAKNVDNVLRIL